MRRLTILSICLALLLSGCGSTNDQTVPIPEDYAIGIVRTIGSKDDSDILYYNENLEQVGATHYQYAAMGQLFYSAVIFDGALYIVPQGQANAKDAKTILRQDLTAFQQKEYFLDQIALYAISVDSEAVYAANNINGQSFVSRIEKEDHTVQTVTFEDAYVSAIYAYHGYLYVFSDENLSAEKRSAIYCLDAETLSQLDMINISSLGNAVYSVVGVEDTLYFLPVKNLNGGFHHIVGAYNSLTGDLDSIDFHEVTHHILNIGGKLYAAHGNLITGEGTELSVYQMSTGEITTYDLGIWPGRIAAYNNSLYVMESGQIGKYDVQTLEKQMEISISLEPGYYLSEIFPYSGR